MLPEVEIADVPLEVHAWTGFLDEYTHISGAPSRLEGLEESLSALLVSEACNVGLTPVVDNGYPPLTRDRLNWIAHNYFRSATHASASTRLFDYHADLALARDFWGGGEMASADGMRFVIPVSTVYAGYNPRFFGRQRGSTLYIGMPTPTPAFTRRWSPAPSATASTPSTGSSPTRRHIQAALDHLRCGELRGRPADLARLSPLGHPTINLQGRYRTTGRAPSGSVRPLRTAR
ncbi:MAG TPA: Tn3 family transposase [Acidimicrobiales bacterium]